MHKASNCRSTRIGKEGKSKMIASCRFLEDALRQYSKEEGSDDGRQCGNAGSRLENESQELGSERKKREDRSAD